MNDEIKKLEVEINVLKERIRILEKKEEKRKIIAIIKFIIILIVIIFLTISIYNIYQEIIDTYNKLINIF